MMIIISDFNDIGGGDSIRGGGGMFLQFSYFFQNLSLSLLIKLLLEKIVESEKNILTRGLTQVFTVS